MKFHRRRLRDLANYDSADILNHFKSGKAKQKRYGHSKESDCSRFL